MPKITLQEKTYLFEEGETVLDALLRHEVEISHSCKAGVCHTCLLKQQAGEVPAEDQVGLKDTLKAQNYFLACTRRPTSDLSIALPVDAHLFSPAMVVEKTALSAQVCRLLLEPTTPLYYHSGQYINVRRSDGLSRSYSLASVPRVDSFVELHIKRMQNGKMSNWIHDELEAGDMLEIQGPQGDAFYISGQPEQKMLLIATGTGLAPVWGIIRDALHSKHSGPIWLYHGDRHPDGLYGHSALTALSEEHRNFHYVPCVSGDDASSGVRKQRANVAALKEHPDLAGVRVFLCGNPPMVNSTRKKVYLQGANLQDIYADPFYLKNLRKEPRT